MVYSANDLLEWKDFPKGLRVLILDEDDSSAAEIRSKLEGMEYIISTFSDASKALSAISSESESFHVAIVEAETIKSQGNLKFLETAKDLPTIMTSNTQCLNTMMKCIALGAVEFLLKPLCEEKLRNIWQHAVHKAFNAGGNVDGKSLKPVKESLASLLQLEIKDENPQSEEMRNISNYNEDSSGLDKYPAPSTPQLKQGARLLDEVDCHDLTNSSTDKERSGEQEGESKSVETTCCNVSADTSFEGMNPPKSGGTSIKEEKDLADVSNSEPSTCPGPKNTVGVTDCASDARKQTRGSDNPNLCGARVKGKKMKVDWTPDLHKKFVQAVEQLGVDQAIPSHILELMKVEGLTRHNVASHLQKFRMHRRHILPKEDDRRWSHSRDYMQRGYKQHRPIVAYPPYHSNQTLQADQSYPVWGQPGGHLPGVQVWRPPGYHHTWQPAENWPWSPYPVVHADAWGCPVMPPPPQGSCSFSQNASTYHHHNAVDNSYVMPGDASGLHPAEEVIDMVVKEAISKPWLPLPLGLKPPSTESVLSELSRQGMSKIPFHPPPN